MPFTRKTAKSSLCCPNPSPTTMGKCLPFSPTALEETDSISETPHYANGTQTFGAGKSYPQPRDWRTNVSTYPLMHVKTSAFYTHWQTLFTVVLWRAVGSRGNSILHAQEKETLGWQPSCDPVSIWSSLTPCKTLRVHQNTQWKSKGIKKHKCDSQFNWDALSGSQGREVPAQFLRVPVQQGLLAVRGAQLQHYKSCHGCVQRPLVRAAPSKEQPYIL